MNPTNTRRKPSDPNDPLAQPSGESVTPPHGDPVVHVARDAGLDTDLPASPEGVGTEDPNAEDIGPEDKGDG